MKKDMLISVMALLFVFSVYNVCQSEPLKVSENISIGGELLTRTFSMKNYKGSEVTDNFVLTRALINTDFSVSSDAAISLLFGHTKVWGNSTSWYQGGTEPGASQNLTGENGFLESICIYNANVRVKNIWQGVDFTIGRQFIGDSEDAIFYYGPQSGRYLAVTSIDAIRADWDMGSLKLMGMYGKKAETGLADGSGKDSTFATSLEYVSNKDTDIYALVLRNSRWLESQDIKVFYYARKKGLDEGKVDQLGLFGMRAQGPIQPLPGFEYDFMFGLDFGKNDENDKTYAGKIWRIIGYYNNTIPSYLGFKLTGGYAYVSGEKESTADKDENFRRIGRDCFYSMAVIVYEILNDAHPEAVTNVVIPFAGIEVVPEAFDRKLSIKMMYSDLSCDTPIAGYTEKGKEIDVNLKYEATDRFSLGFTGARFYPGDLLKAAFNSDNPITQLSTELVVSF